MEHVWNFAPVLASRELLALGLLNTLKLAALTLATGLTLGLFVGAARFAKTRALRWPATAFIELFRNTPVLVQIMWFYFAFPILAPVRIGPFEAAALGLALNTTAFAAEIFRAGLQSIHRGQWEGARALGMTYGQQMRRVVLPQAVRRMIPAFMNRAVELLKMTSLASVIAYGELMHQAKTVATYHFNPIETYTVVALTFFAIVYPLALAVQRVEKELSRHG